MRLRNILNKIKEGRLRNILNKIKEEIILSAKESSIELEDIKINKGKHNVSAITVVTKNQGTLTINYFRREQELYFCVSKEESLYNLSQKIGSHLAPQEIFFPTYNS